MIELSVTLEHGSVSEPMAPKIRYIDHKKGAWHMRFLFGVKSMQLKGSPGRMKVLKARWKIFWGVSQEIPPGNLMLGYHVRHPGSRRL